MKVYICSLTVISMILLAACSTPKIQVMSLEPCKAGEATQLRKISVLPFEGKGGESFSSEFEAMLGSIKIDDKQYFDVVSRTALNKIMNEMQFSQSGLVDPQTAAKIGKIVGAKGMFIGEITNASVNDSDFKEERSKCTSSNKKGICTSSRNYTVNCVKRTALLTVSPKLVEVDSTRIIFSDSYNDTSNSSKCSDSSSPLEGEGQMLASLKKRILDKIRNDVAPYYKQIEIKLLDKNDGIVSDKAKMQLEAGIEFAKNHRFERSCEIWGEAFELAPNSISYLHNLAICKEIEGKLEEAFDMLKKADKQLLSPNDTISESLSRVKSGIAKRNKLKNQMGRS